jgi:hypothetical protein
VYPYHVDVDGMVHDDDDDDNGERDNTDMEDARDVVAIRYATPSMGALFIIVATRDNILTITTSHMISSQIRDLFDVMTQSEKINGKFETKQLVRKKHLCLMLLNHYSFIPL